MAVLYRKYRPQSFDEVVGQDHVVTTLKNALEMGRVAHAYLFAGPRGTGKTSVARILAQNLKATELDLVEIDAASHRGIDDIRDLREQVNFLPTQSPKKVYILDEVHMLTKEAFNALLKTLEEPPEHAHFILCTTEPHKLPLTVVSRCQRFDFNLASNEVLENFIKKIVRNEKVELPDRTRKLIVHLAQGSYRDALGLLETLVNHAQKEHLTDDKAQKILGLVNQAEARDLNRLILDKNYQTALEKIKGLSESGIDFHYLLQTMIDCLRSELDSFLSKTPPPKGQIIEYLNLIKLLHQASQEVKLAVSSSLPLEMLVVGWGIKGECKQEYSQPPVSELKPLWSKVLVAVKPHNHSVEALLKGCEPLDLSGNILTLKFFYQFHKERIEEPQKRELVERIVGEIVGKPIKIRCTLEKRNSNKTSAPDEPEKAEFQNPTAVNAAELLETAQRVFGGEIIE